MLVTKILQWVGMGGKSTAFMGNVAGYLGMAIFTYEFWSLPYKSMDALRYAPNYIDSDGNPVYVNSDDDYW